MNMRIDLPVNFRLHQLQQRNHATITVKETWDNRECPDTTRDFDFEGSIESLWACLLVDAEEYGCTRYIVLNTGDSPFAIWRTYDPS